MSTDKILTKAEIEEKLRALSEEEINFSINVNNILGGISPEHFQDAVHVISKALFLLQTDKLPGNVNNVTTISNKILQRYFTLNRAEVICILYYLQQNIGTIEMAVESNEMPTWSIRADIFKKLST
jgi:hypothetical protein